MTINTRALPIALAATVLLSACSWFKGPKGPLPSPLPHIYASADLKQVWQAKTGVTSGTLLRPAAYLDGLIAGGRNGSLVRLDGAGKEVWRTRSVSNLVGGVAAGGSLVVVGSDEGVLVAHDANTGALLWKVQAAGELGGTAFVSDSLVVARIGDSQLIAYSATDGKRLWSYQRAPSPLSLRTFSGMTRSGDLLLAGFPGGKLVALTIAGGFPRWEASIAAPRGSNELERMTDVSGDPVVRGESVCVGAFQGRIACVEREKGALQWTRDYSSAQGVVAEGKTVVFTDATGNVFSLDVQTGATIWKQDQLQYRGVGRPVFVSGAVAVADRQGWIHLLDPVDGHFVGQIRVDNSGVNAPMLTLANGLLAVQALDGTVVALAVRY